MPVRQHYNLATTGKLGQGGKSAGKRGTAPAPAPARSGKSHGKGGGYGGRGGKS